MPGIHAYLSNDRKAVEDAFTEDFHFASPYDDEIDKATYFVRCWRVSFRNTEFFSFEGDKIKHIDVYFGATYQDGVFVRQSES